MLKVVKVAMHRINNDSLDFKLIDIDSGAEYLLLYSHRTDNPWFSFITKCYFGELYKGNIDLGPAFLQWTIGGKCLLSYKMDES